LYFGSHFGFKFKMATIANQRWVSIRNIIIYYKPKKSESVRQILPQLPWKQKRGNLKKNDVPFIKLHETL
jgi:hypothetical protein